MESNVSRQEVTQNHNTAHATQSFSFFFGYVLFTKLFDVCICLFFLVNVLCVRFQLPFDAGQLFTLDAQQG